MNEITLVLFLCGLFLFVVSYIVRQNQIHWLTFFVSICSICQSIFDESLTQEELAILVAPMLFVLFMSGWNSWGMKDGRR